MTMAAAEAPVTEIQLVELEFGTERLGSGGSGTVYKGRWKRIGVTVAIKTLIQEIPAKEVGVMHAASFNSTQIDVVYNTLLCGRVISNVQHCIAWTQICDFNTAVLC